MHEREDLQRTAASERASASNQLRARIDEQGAALASNQNQAMGQTHALAELVAQRDCIRSGLLSQEQEVQRLKRTLEAVADANTQAHLKEHARVAGKLHFLFWAFVLLCFVLVAWTRV